MTSTAAAVTFREAEYQPQEGLLDELDELESEQTYNWGSLSRYNQSNSRMNMGPQLSIEDLVSLDATKAKHKATPTVPNNLI